MALTYNTFTTSLANMIVVPISDPYYAVALSVLAAMSYFPQFTLY